MSMFPFYSYIIFFLFEKFYYDHFHRFSINFRIRMEIYYTNITITKWNFKSKIHTTHNISTFIQNVIEFLLTRIGFVFFSLNWILFNSYPQMYCFEFDRMKLNWNWFFNIHKFTVDWEENPFIWAHTGKKEQKYQVT